MANKYNYNLILGDDVSENAVCETDKLHFYKERGERLLKDYSELIYKRFLIQSNKWKGKPEGQQLESLLEFFGSMRNSSVVRNGIVKLIGDLEQRSA